MGAGPPKDNKNAEKWTLEDAQAIFKKAIDLATNGKTEDLKGGEITYDFIGEIARELGTYRDVFTYLSDKYSELKPQHKELLTALEANCFSHGKSGEIVPSLAIMNLKSNHGWTDRVDQTTKGKETNTIINLGSGIKPDDKK